MRAILTALCLLPTTLLAHGVYVNSDAWNFWADHDFSAADRTGLVKALEEDVDYYTARGGVRAILWNMNFQRSFYPTKAGTPYWKDLALDGQGRLLLRGKPIDATEVEENTATMYRRMFLNAKRMNETLPDFMKVRYDLCRKRGVESWFSMRMNDVHWAVAATTERPQHGDLWREHPEFRRAWYRSAWRANWHDGTLDYGRKEVYDCHLAMAKEYLLDYESDGLELDWMRSSPVLRPGAEEEGAAILTRFVREVRAAAVEAARKWGHPVRVAMRVPARVSECLAIGMDVPAWAAEGLVDVVVPAPPSHVRTEQDADITLWRKLLPASVTLAPAIDYAVSTDGNAALTGDNETDCAFASNFYRQGADTVYFYNHFPRHARERADAQEAFPLCADRAKAAAHVRRHVLTRHIPVGEGAAFDYRHFDTYRLNLGEGVAERRAVLVVGTRRKGEFEIRVNGETCRELGADDLPKRLPGGTISWRTAEVKSAHDGWNVVEFTDRTGDPIRPEELVWLEISIREKNPEGANLYNKEGLPACAFRW